MMASVLIHLAAVVGVLLFGAAAVLAFFSVVGVLLVLAGLVGVIVLACVCAPASARRPLTETD